MSGRRADHSAVSALTRQVHPESDAEWEAALREFENAVAVLEDNRYGALTLIGDKHPAGQDSTYIEEAYKTALSAYIVSMISLRLMARMDSWQIAPLLPRVPPTGIWI